MPLIVKAWPFGFAYPVIPPVGVDVALVVVEAFDVLEEGLTVEVVNVVLEDDAGLVDVLDPTLARDSR